MKKMINNLLRPFHAEIHGVGYLKKLQKNACAPSALDTQARLFNNKASVIFDIGANKGSVSKHYRELFPGVTIHAFEPFTPLHEVFRMNNPDTKHVHLSNLALSDKEGEADFFLNEVADTNSLYESISIGASSDKACKNVGTQKIKTSTLEKYCGEKNIHHIDILKMDTQGAELPILKGGEQLLRQRTIQLIYAEGFFKPQYKDQPLLYDVASYLTRFGYYLEGIYNPYYNNKFMLWCDAIFLPTD